MESVGIQSNAMEMNGSARHRSPLPPPPNASHLVNGNGAVEQWTKLTDHTNGHDQVTNCRIAFSLYHVFLIY